MPSLPYPHEPFSCLSTLYVSPRGPLWTSILWSDHPLRQWDYPIEAIWPIAQKVVWQLFCCTSCVLEEPTSLCDSSTHQPHNASGRKWICSFKWCMGVLLSCWTPFCGQEWSSLNYLPNGINSAERKLAELLSSFTLWQIHSKICFKRWTTYWLVF